MQKKCKKIYKPEDHKNLISVLKVVTSSMQTTSQAPVSSLKQSTQVTCATRLFLNSSSKPPEVAEDETADFMESIC